MAWLDRLKRWFAAGREPRSAFWPLAVFTAMLCVGVGVLSDQFGLLDWDTYARMHFINGYRPDLYTDGHLLYHHVLLWIIRLIGLSPLRAALFLTAVSYAAFVSVLFALGQREGLTPRQLVLVLLLATLGSPGLICEVLWGEDNVAYLPLIALLFYWLPRPAASARDNIRVGLACGAVLALAMLINITMLIFLFSVAAAPLLAWRRLKQEAVRLTVMCAAALGFYYLAHLTVFFGCRVALHDFLPQALRLQDFAQSEASLLSFARLGQYIGGFKAMTWLPSAHFMHFPSSIRGALTSYLPWILIGLYLLLAASGLSTTLGPLRDRLRRAPLSIVLFGIALAFPFFYEPALIERWDMAWVGLLVLLLRQLRRPAVPFASVCVALIAAVQLTGSAITITNHYQLLFVSPELDDAREVVRRVRREKVAVVVLPESTRRAYVAYIKHHTRLQALLLARAEAARTRWYQIPRRGLLEREVQLSAVRKQIATARGNVYLHPGLHASLVRALGGPR